MNDKDFDNECDKILQGASDFNMSSRGLNKMFIGMMAFTFIMAAGWIMNIVSIYSLFASGNDITPMAVFRMIGVVVVPLGSILGFL